MTIRAYAGELIGTLSIVAISGLTVLVAGLVSGTDFDASSGLKRIPTKSRRRRKRRSHCAEPPREWARPHS